MLVSVNTKGICVRTGISITARKSLRINLRQNFKGGSPLQFFARFSIWASAESQALDA